MANRDLTDRIYDAAIVGGGPAGMMAALVLAEAGYHVIILERNKLLGRKLRITGKGRCNLTNTCDAETLFSNIISGSRFLRSALNRFSNRDLMEFFENGGLKLAEERGGRVFPESRKARDVAEFFVKKLKTLKVHVLYEANVTALLFSPAPQGGKKVSGVSCMLGGDTVRVNSRSVLLAAGGATYPATGSDGSGYRLSLTAGHTVTEPLPSLTGLRCLEFRDCASVCGITLKNVQARLYGPQKQVFEGFGEVLFTDRGISGPTVLSMSRTFAASAGSAGTRISDTEELNAALRRNFPHTAVRTNITHLDVSGKNITPAREQSDICARDGASPYRSGYFAELDLKPALTDEMLDARLLRELSAARGKKLANALAGLLPGPLLAMIFKRAGTDPDMKASALTRKQREDIIYALKHLRFNITGPDEPDLGVVTQGGVELKEIDPKTMASKIADGLFFAGEIIDVDGLTGGYNLTVAFSTGHAAGEGIAAYLSGAVNGPGQSHGSGRTD